MLYFSPDSFKLIAPSLPTNYIKSIIKEKKRKERLTTTESVVYQNKTSNDF